MKSKIIRRFFLIALASFAIGCIPMIGMWFYFGKTYASTIPGCMGYFDYLAVKYGDMFCLPVMNAAIFCACKEHLGDEGIKKKAMIIGALGGITGIAIQLSWIFPLKDSTFIPSNWTFDRSGMFNAAGGYHAVFFIAEIAFTCAFFLADWLSGIKTRKTRAEKFFQICALLSGSLFLMLHNVDDYRGYGILKVILLTIVGETVVIAIYYLSQLVFRRRCFYES